MLMSFNVITQQENKKKILAKRNSKILPPGVSGVGLVFKWLVPFSQELHELTSYQTSLIASN
jgi:hypothetical protein